MSYTVDEKLHQVDMSALLHNYIKLTILSFRASEARRSACPVLRYGGIQYYQWFPGYRPSPVRRLEWLCKALDMSLRVVDRQCWTGLG